MDDSLKRRRRMIPAAFFIILYAVLLLFNFCTPLLADDYNYSYIWACDDLRMISPLQIPDSMMAHRAYTNGRAVSHSFVQFFLIYNKAFFNFVNPAMSCLIVFLIYLIVKRFTHRPLLFTALGTFMIWLFCPVFGQIFLWLDGACNYSWGVAFLMMFLMPFAFHYINKPAGHNLILNILYIIEAFAAGAYSENGSTAALFCAFLLLILIYIRFKKLPAYLILSFLGGCAGYLFLILSPSMLGGARGEISPEAILGIFGKIFSKLSRLIAALGPKLCLLLLLAAAAVIIYLIAVRKKRKLFYFSIIGAVSAAYLGVLALLIIKKSGSGLRLIPELFSSSALNLISLVSLFLILFFLALYYKADKDVITLSLVSAAGSFVSIAVFAFALYLPARSTVHMVFYLSLSCLLLAGEIYRKGSARGRKFIRILTIIIIVLFALSFVLGFWDLLSLGIQSSERMEIIEPLRESGEPLELPVYTHFTKYSPLSGLEDIAPGSEGWINDMMKVYYHLGTITGITA